MSRFSAWLLLVGVLLVGAAGLVVALSDAGLPLPGAVLAAAFALCLAGIAGAGVLGFRGSRADGRGFWRSVGTGFRTSFRTVLELF